MDNKNIKKLKLKTIISFFLTFILCTLIISISIINKTNVEKLKMEQLIVEKSIKANAVLSRLLYKTETLAALVVGDNNETENFLQIASIINDDPAILNVLIAPGGVVSKVYPLKGNEAVIGLDFFKEGEGNKEAILAKETGQLVFGGPFNSVQGVQILVGRLPVYVDNEFWGLVSVTLKYPEALEGAGLNELSYQGFAYEIWRINPDDGQKQIISESAYKYNNKTLYLEKSINIQNAQWFFRILPVKAWYEYPDTWLLVFLGICISLLVAFVVQNNSELKILKNNFQNLSYTDALTGIYNRRYFMDTAQTYIEKAFREKSNAFLIIFDLDYFKKINDTYGHIAGDEVLKNVALRVKETLRPYDLFSRYGGEEFIILVTDIKDSDVKNMTERIRQNIMEKPITSNELKLSVTASFGISNISVQKGFIKAIDAADKALYKAKEEGRNKVVFLTEFEN